MNRKLLLTLLSMLIVIPNFGFYRDSGDGSGGTDDKTEDKTDDKKEDKTDDKTEDKTLELLLLQNEELKKQNDSFKLQIEDAKNNKTKDKNKDKDKDKKSLTIEDFEEFYNKKRAKEIEDMAISKKEKIIKSITEKEKEKIESRGISVSDYKIENLEKVLNVIRKETMILNNADRTVKSYDQEEDFRKKGAKLLEFKGAQK